MTSEVIAKGKGDFIAEWNIERGEQPFVGDQLFACTLCVPKDLRELKFQARVYVTVGAFYEIATRLCSKWVDLEGALLAN